MIKLNWSYKIKLVQAYAPTTCHDDEAVERFYDNAELAMKDVKTQYTMVIGEFNAKVAKKQAAEQALGKFANVRRNSRGDALIGFTDRNSPRFINTLFGKRKNKKWT